MLVFFVVDFSSSLLPPLLCVFADVTEDTAIRSLANQRRNAVLKMTEQRLPCRLNSVVINQGTDLASAKTQQPPEFSKPMIDQRHLLIQNMLLGDMVHRRECGTEPSLAGPMVDVACNAINISIKHSHAAGLHWASRRETKRAAIVVTVTLNVI